MTVKNKRHYFYIYQFIAYQVTIQTNEIYYMMVKKTKTLFPQISAYTSNCTDKHNILHDSKKQRYYFYAYSTELIAIKTNKVI